jgi:hypothetical protein
VSTLGFTNVYNIGGFVANPAIGDFFPTAGVPEVLETPSNLVLNRGHIEELAFGGPIGLSWDEVANRSTFTVFAFNDENQTNPNEAYTQVGSIDALFLDVNTVVPASSGSFWFRVQAVGDNVTNSALSEARGPFWNTAHSDEFQFEPERNLGIFEDPTIPVIVMDMRTPAERTAQGHVTGDIHVMWPNAAAVEQGATHAAFQNEVLAIWQNFVDNDLTDAQRANLDPTLGYRDIHLLIY